MGYHLIDPDEIEPTPDRPCTKRSISDALDLENVGLHFYEADPGEAIPLAYHYHDEQEEAFYVVDGTLHVETPEGTYEIEADQLFVVEPDSPQRAYNPESADERVRTLVLGAPPIDDVHPYEA